MQMTTKLNVLAAAVGLALSIGAQAAPIKTDAFTLNGQGNVGGGTGIGNLVLAMFDGTGIRSAVFNTGLTAATFNTASTGSFNVSIASADLTKLNTFIGASPAAGFRWNIVAIDNRLNDLAGSNGGPFWDPYGFQSTAAVGTVISTANGPNSADPGITDALSNANVYFGAQNTKTGNPLATSNVAVTAPDQGPSAFTGNWGNNFGGAVKFNNVGKLGDSLAYYFFHGVGVDPGLGQVASSKYAGKWKLDFTASSTKLSYTVPSAIPVPPAMLLMGSAIAGLIATRRRKAS